MPTTKHTIIVDAKIDGFKTKFEQLTSKLDEFSKKEYGAAFDAKKLNTFQTQAKGVIEKLKDFRTKTDESVGATLRRTGQQIAAGVQQVGGAVAGAAGGGGAGGMAGLAGLAAKLGAAGAVAGIPLALYGAASMAGAPRRGIAGQNLQIMGLGGPRGLGQLEGLRQQGMGYGYGARETLQQQVTGMRAMGGGFQARPFQRMARMMGLSPEELIGAGGGLRQAGIGAGQIPRAVEDMYVRAVAHGFDKSRAFDYMKAVSDHTAQLAQTGGVSFKNIVGITTGLMKSPFFTQNAQRGLVAMTGVSQAMTSQGPMASVALRALSSLMPGASMKDLLYAQQFGLEELTTKGRSSRGMPSASRQMKAFMDTMSQMVTGKNIRDLTGDEDSIRMLVPVMKQQFGFRATMADELVRAMAGGAKVDEKKTEALLAAEQKRANVQLSDIQASMDMNTEIQKAKLTELTMDIGDVLVPIVQSINAAIWKVVDWFATLMPGGAQLTPEEQARRTRASEAPLESYRSRIEKGVELSPYQQKEYVGFAGKRRQELLEQRAELLRSMPQSMKSFGGEAFSTTNLFKTPAEFAIADINAELAKLAQQTKILTDSMRKHTDAVDQSTASQGEYDDSIQKVKDTTIGTRKLKYSYSSDADILNIDSFDSGR